MKTLNLILSASFFFFVSFSFNASAQTGKEIYSNLSHDHKMVMSFLSYIVPESSILNSDKESLSGKNWRMYQNDTVLTYIGEHCGMEYTLTYEKSSGFIDVKNLAIFHGVNDNGESIYVPGTATFSKCPYGMRFVITGEVNGDPLAYLSDIYMRHNYYAYTALGVVNKVKALEVFRLYKNDEAESLFDRLAAD